MSNKTINPLSYLTTKMQARLLEHSARLHVELAMFVYWIVIKYEALCRIVYVIACLMNKLARNHLTEANFRLSSPYTLPSQLIRWNWDFVLLVMVCSRHSTKRARPSKGFNALGLFFSQHNTFRRKWNLWLFVCKRKLRTFGHIGLFKHVQISFLAYPHWRHFVVFFFCCVPLRSLYFWYSLTTLFYTHRHFTIQILSAAFFSFWFFNFIFLSCLFPSLS